jgi:hypothetical protein
VTNWLPWIVFAGLLSYVAWMNGRKGPPAAPALPSLLPPGRALPSLGHQATSSEWNPLTIAPWLLVAVLAWAHFSAPPAPAPGPQPTPVPVPDGWPALDLRGAFVGETAAADALTTQYLSDSLAGWVAYDGKLAEPRLTTGAAFADLRKIARDGRLEGLTLGARQPLAKERIKAFLDAAVGDFGGHADTAMRDKFVRAMRTVSEKSAEAVGKKP